MRIKWIDYLRPALPVSQHCYFLWLVLNLPSWLLKRLDSTCRALSVIFQTRVTLSPVGVFPLTSLILLLWGERIFWRLWLFFSTVYWGELDTHTLFSLGLQAVHAHPTPTPLFSWSTAVPSLRDIQALTPWVPALSRETDGKSMTETQAQPPLRHPPPRAPEPRSYSKDHPPAKPVRVDLAPAIIATKSGSSPWQSGSPAPASCAPLWGGCPVAGSAPSPFRVGTMGWSSTDAPPAQAP